MTQCTHTQWDQAISSVPSVSHLAIKYIQTGDKSHLCTLAHVYLSTCVPSVHAYLKWLKPLYFQLPKAKKHVLNGVTYHLTQT